MQKQIDNIRKNKIAVSHNKSSGIKSYKFFKRDSKYSSGSVRVTSSPFQNCQIFTVSTVGSISTIADNLNVPVIEVLRMIKGKSRKRLMMVDSPSYNANIIRKCGAKIHSEHKYQNTTGSQMVQFLIDMRSITLNKVKEMCK